MSKVLFEKHGSLAILTLNDPKTANSLSSSLLEELREILKILNDPHLPQKKIRGLLLKANGKVFCAGANIKEMAKMTASEGMSYAEKAQKIFNDLADLPFPVVAAVHGAALGGGLELALACDLILAGHNAEFAAPEVKLGLIPCFGGLVRLPHLVGPQKAKEMIFSGRKINPKLAHEIGLAGHIFKTEQEMYEYAFHFLYESSKNSPHGISLAKYITNKIHFDLDLTSQALKLEREGFGQCLNHTEAQVGLEAFTQKTIPVYI